jgi:hypothetical protein
LNNGPSEVLTIHLSLWHSRLVPFHLLILMFNVNVQEALDFDSTPWMGVCPTAKLVSYGTIQHVIPRVEFEAVTPMF